MTQKATLPLSIVIPVYNEAENIPYLYSSVKGAMERIGVPYEVIVVDDGSKDETLALLERVHKEDPRWIILSLRRNFGQTAALSAGFDYAKGEVIVTMDGDLQNDPEDIGKLLELIKDHDIVSGWRFKRQDPFLSRRLPSMIANWAISWVTGVKLHDYGCTLKAYRRDVVKNLRLYGEMHRFIPAIASWMGISIAEIKTNHRPRRFGKSKYGFSRTLRVILDLITVKFLLSFSTKPIQAFGLLGFLSAGLGFLISIYLTALKLFYGQNIGGRPLLLMGVLLLILGVQLVVMGLLGEMLVRTYYEAQGKSIYILKKVIHPHPIPGATLPSRGKEKEDQGDEIG